MAAVVHLALLGAVMISLLSGFHSPVLLLTDPMLQASLPDSTVSKPCCADRVKRADLCVRWSGLGGEMQSGQKMNDERNRPSTV